MKMCPDASLEHVKGFKDIEYVWMLLQYLACQ